MSLANLAPHREIQTATRRFLLRPIAPLLSLMLAVGFLLATDAMAIAQDDGMDSTQPADAVNMVENSNPTDLDATAETKSGLSLISLLMRGGWFMLPLGFLSLAVVAIGVERFVTLRKEKLFPHKLVRKLSLLSQIDGGLDPRRAYQTCQEYPSSAAYVIRNALTRVGRPLSEIENAVDEASQREANRLSSLGSWLTLAAAVAPLIGLLGTVWGITQAFYDTTQLVAGQNRSEALAQGIYTALVTTMCGLMIAIPAAVMAHYFENKIMSMINQIQEMIYNLLPQFERYEGQMRFNLEAETNGAAKPDRKIKRPAKVRAEQLAQSESGTPANDPETNLNGNFDDLPAPNRRRPR